MLAKQAEEGNHEHQGPGTTKTVFFCAWNSVCTGHCCSSYGDSNSSGSGENINNS